MAEGLDQAKLSAFFRELTPAARARLASAMEGEAGAQLPFRALILEPLTAARRALGEIPSPEQLLLAPLEPFVREEGAATKIAGTVSRASRDRIAQWLVRSPAADIVASLSGAQPSLSAIEAARDALAAKLAEVVSSADTTRAQGRLNIQIGSENGVADLQDIATVLKRRAVLAKFAADIASVGTQTDETLKTVKAHLDQIALRYPDSLIFALVLTRARLPNPQSFVRLAAMGAESTDGARICETSYARVLDIALAEAEHELGTARKHATAVDRADFLRAVRAFGAAIRALSTEVDLVPDGLHARRLAAMRGEMAECVRADLQDISPRMRKLVRPRGQERLAQGHEMVRLEADLDLLLIARSYAEEIALNALSARVFGEVRDLLDPGTQQLIERLRSSDENAKPALRERLALVVKMSAKIFGADYAALMAKAVDVAGQEPRPQLRSA